MADNVETAHELETLDRAFETALVDGDITTLESLLADDFTYVHGDAWTRGEPPMRVDDKATVLQSARDGVYTHRTTASSTAEIHASTGIVEGSYDAGLKTKKGVVEFFVRYVRVYDRTDAGWSLVTHRTVQGPEFRSTDA